MKNRRSILACAVLIGVGAGAFVLLKPSALASTPQRDVRQIEYGRYLVHQVGMCVDCHSPRDERGQFVEAEHLTGAKLDFVATIPIPWAGIAPGLAGLPGHYTEESMVRFLMTGERPGGLPPALPPMPAVRLNEKDAAAVTAYLLSLRR